MRSITSFLHSVRNGRRKGETDMGSNFGDLNLQCRDLLELALREIDRSEKALLQIVMFAMFQLPMKSNLRDMLGH
jgi:hypothetical protein